MICCALSSLINNLLSLGIKLMRKLFNSGKSEGNLNASSVNYRPQKFKNSVQRPRISSNINIYPNC